MVVASCIISGYSDFYLLFQSFITYETNSISNSFYLNNLVWLLFTWWDLTDIQVPHLTRIPELQTLEVTEGSKGLNGPAGIWWCSSDVHVLSLCPQSQDQIHSWKIKRSSRSFTPKHTHWDENHYSIIKDHLLRQYTPLFLPGKSHGQRSLVATVHSGHKESDTTEHAHTHGQATQ